MSFPSKHLTGTERDAAIATIIANHYAHSVSSGKSHYFGHGAAVVAYSIPANKNVANFLLGYKGKVWELSRLWAPDKHEPNLLTSAISGTTKLLLALEDVDALVSYADPNVGHVGYVYRAASWLYLGQCEEGRYYRDSAGQVVSRRAFHSGNRHMNKAEILALGYQEFKLPGKHRYARPLSRRARKSKRLRSLVKPYPKEELV